MTELLTLLGRHLRVLVRSRLALVAAILFLLGLVTALGLGREAGHAPALPLLVAMLFMLVLAAAAASGSGTILPEDRITGCEEWLATLAPPAWKRRMAVALAGWLLAATVGLLGGLAIGLAVSAFHPASRMHRAVELPLHRRALIEGPRRGDEQGPAWTLALPARRDANTLEIVLRPLFRQRFDSASLAWRSDAHRGDIETSGHGPVRIELGPQDSHVALALRTRGVNLRVLEARILGAQRAPVLALTLAGLLLGLLAGSVAPVAVLVSRGTSGQTAAAAAFCLLLFGAVREGLLTLAGDLDLHGASAAAPAVLRGVSLLAPDAPLFRVLGETLASRSLEGELALLLPALAYTVVAVVLAALPLPARFAGGGGS